MEDFNHFGICWRGNTGGHKQIRKFQECIDSFWTQVIKELLRGDVLLELIIRNKKELARD